MTKTTKSPFGTSFKSAMKKGTPCFTAVCSIAKRCGKSPTTVFSSLCKAGLCSRQRFNGSWIYFATCPCKPTSTNSRTAQCTFWQSFCDWCICSGNCTPKQLWNNCGTQEQFMNFCKKFFNCQFNGGTAGFNGKKTNWSFTNDRSWNVRVRKAA